MISALQYIEVDVPRCSLVYGTAPCTASIPTTGSIKCYQSRKTCQDIENFDEEVFTVRFSEAGDQYPADIEAINSLAGVSYTPAVVSLGENLGQRASLSVTFKDHRWSDTGGFDKYLADRDYDPFTQGTFWGKFRGRHRSLRGKAIRFIQGSVSQTLAEMETRHFLIESFEGPSPDGAFTIVAKDALKFADGDRSQAPVLSNGFLNAVIDDNDLSLTLSPAGIGNAEYPTGTPDYYVAIGGKEIVKVTSRSGDVLTIQRAQFNTEAVAHDAQDRVQLCLVYESEPPEFILNDLFVNYCGLSADYIPYSSWEAESASKLGQVYSVCIPEPTGVDKLASEIVQVCGLAVWWDDLFAKIRFNVLGTVSTDAALFDRSNTIEATFGIRDQPERRASQIWVYYGQINPLKKVDETDNYRSTAITADFDAEDDYGTPAIKKIFARWIADLGRSVALRVGALQLGRFVDPPRAISLDIHRENPVAPVLGSGYQVKALCLQDETGAAATVPIQITRLRPDKDRWKIEAQEMLFTAQDDFNPDDRTIIVDGNRFNINLRDAYDQLYPTPDSDTVVNCIIESGVIVGSLNTSLFAFEVGDWSDAVGVEINLVINGRIQGKGGNGAIGSVGSRPGDPGGPALRTTVPINVENLGDIFSGGGGGGDGDSVDGRAGGGGGGAGAPGGIGGIDRDGAKRSGDGTTEAGGAGGTQGGDGGAGGGPGLPGNDGPHSGTDWGAGGAAGTAIDGVSNITFIGPAGDIRGPQIN